MKSNETLKEDTMFVEAVDRLELMKVQKSDMQMILMNRALDLKIVVDHKKKTIRRDELTEEELQMVKNIEEKYGFICYYLIQDEGVWPDGCTFPRYTLLYVDENVNEYEMKREECIKRCGTVPAYVVNMEEAECSEMTEIKFKNVGGNLINVS